MPMKKKFEYPAVYRGKALIADPIYQYAWFTVPTPDIPREKTEKDLIDSPWIQRLRRINQLQSARWVYPAAEHSRYQHSLGAMHMAGEFGRYLYPSLKDVCGGVPSINYIEEMLRVAGLLHDVGHGPYGHFFDDEFLEPLGLNHERLGQEIIRKKLGKLIRDIRRSPTGPFESREALDPAQIAFLIKMPDARDRHQPPWLQMLRQLFSGIYTVDNLDYVRRDAYMTGFSMDIVDISRLRFYTFFTKEGLTLHQAGISALSRFINARLNLYANVYYHRTTRAIDLHLQEIFRETMGIIFPYHPLEELDEYLKLDDWYLFAQVRNWPNSRVAARQRLGKEWEKIHARSVKWKMSFSAELSIDEVQKGTRFSRAEVYEKQIRRYLPEQLRSLKFRVDLATQDPRPLNPMVEGEKRINIFNPLTNTTSLEPLKDIYRFIPARVVHFRVFALNHEYDKEIAAAADEILGTLDAGFKTNI